MSNPQNSSDVILLLIVSLKTDCFSKQKRCQTILCSCALKKLAGSFVFSPNSELPFNKLSNVSIYVQSPIIYCMILRRSRPYHVTQSKEAVAILVASQRLRYLFHCGKVRLHPHYVNNHGYSSRSVDSLEEIVRDLHIAHRPGGSGHRSYSSMQSLWLFPKTKIPLNMC